MCCSSRPLCRFIYSSNFYSYAYDLPTTSSYSLRQPSCFCFTDYNQTDFCYIYWSFRVISCLRVSTREYSASSCRTPPLRMTSGVSGCSLMAPRSYLSCKKSRSPEKVRIISQFSLSWRWWSQSCFRASLKNSSLYFFSHRLRSVSSSAILNSCSLITPFSKATSYRLSLSPRLSPNDDSRL